MIYFLKKLGKIEQIMSKKLKFGMRVIKKVEDTQISKFWRGMNGTSEIFNTKEEISFSNFPLTSSPLVEHKWSLLDSLGMDDDLKVLWSDVSKFRCILQCFDK